MPSRSTRHTPEYLASPEILGDALLTGSGTVGAAGSLEAVATAGLVGAGFVGAAAAMEMEGVVSILGTGTIYADAISGLPQAIVGEPPAEFIYKVVVSYLDGDPIEEIPVKNLQYSYTHNGPGSINFVLPIKHPKCTRQVLEPGQREIRLYRNNDLYWGGYLWTASAGQEGNVARFGGEGWFSRTRFRKIRETFRFAQEEQLEIAWALWEYTQGRAGGDMGITRYDDTPTGVLRDRTYFAWEQKALSEALTQLANVENGFDWQVSAAKEWITYYPQRGTRKNQTFELGKNISSCYSVLDATSVASDMTALGAGEGFSMLTSTYQDADTLAKFGLMEQVKSFKDVEQISMLEEHAQEEQYKVRDTKDKPQLQVFGSDPQFGEYDIADEIYLKVDNGYQQIYDYYRIIALVVAQSNAGNEAFGVYLDNNNSLEEEVSV